MSQQSTLTLNTRAYLPRGVRDGIANWVYMEDTVFNGNSNVSESVRGPSKDGVYRSTFKVDTPLVADSDSACGCAGTVLSKAMTRIETIYPATWTQAQRQEHRKRVKDLVNDAVFTAALDDLEGAW